MLAPIAAVLLALAGPRLEASLLAGGGYDANLNHAERTAGAVGAGFLSLRATGGLALDGEETGVYAGVRLDAEQYPELSQLTTGIVGVEGSLVRELAEGVAIVLAPSAFRGWSGEGARDLTGVAGLVLLRVKPTRDLALRGFYGHSRRFAADPVFSAERDRVGASGSLRVGERVHLTVAYSLERGHEVFYEAAAGTTAGFGGMGGRMGTVTTFGGADQAVRAVALGHAFGPSVELDLGGGVHLQASYERRLVESDAADFATHSVFAGLGVRR